MDRATIHQVGMAIILHPKTNIAAVTQIKERGTGTAAQVANITNLPKR